MPDAAENVRDVPPAAVAALHAAYERVKAAQREVAIIEHTMLAMMHDAPPGCVITGYCVNPPQICIDPAVSDPAARPLR